MIDHGMGADPLAAITGDLTDRVTAAILPKLTEAVKKSTEAAAPMIYDMLPTLGLYAILAIGVGAVASAAIGSYYATKVRRRAA